MTPLSRTKNKNRKNHPQSCPVLPCSFPTPSAAQISCQFAALITHVLAQSKIARCSHSTIHLQWLAHSPGSRPWKRIAVHRSLVHLPSLTKARMSLAACPPTIAQFVLGIPWIFPSAAPRVSAPSPSTCATALDDALSIRPFVARGTAKVTAAWPPQPIASTLPPTV
jgi:hypothetical protein